MEKYFGKKSVFSHDLWRIATTFSEYNPEILEQLEGLEKTYTQHHYYLIKPNFMQKINFLQVTICTPLYSPELQSFQHEMFEINIGLLKHCSHKIM